MIKSKPSTSLSVDALISSLQNLPKDDLRKVQTAISEMVVDKPIEKNSLASIVYEEIKKRMRLVLDVDTRKPRYTYTQLESMKPWRSLSIKSQKNFEKAWQSSLEFFIGHGFSNNSTLVNLILNIVVRSPLMSRGELSLDNIIATLTSIDSIVDETLPGWFDSSNAKAMMLMSLSTGTRK